MSDEGQLAPFNSQLPMNPSDLAQGLAQVNSQLHGSMGGTAFLRLLKSGTFAYGPEAIEPEPGALWGVNPYSLMHGWACWGDGELLDERMVPFNQQAPLRSELPDHGYEWSQQISLLMACATGEDQGVQVLYKGTSTGLRNASKVLIDAIITQVQRDQENIVPLVRLECSSYQHKKYGEIFVPHLPIDRWVSMDTMAVDEDESDAGGQDSADDAEDAHTDPEPKAGGRRRRRRAS